MLFAYGTLQDPDILGAVLGRVVDLTGLQPAHAQGYKAVAYPGRPYPALVPSPGATTAGRAIGRLSAADWTALDAFEGEEYSRASIELAVCSFTLPVHAYFPIIATPPHGPAWRLDDWTIRHKPSVLAAETALAKALRDRLASATQ